MSTQAKVAIYEPKTGEKERYFTFRLKSSLDAERTVFRSPEKVLVIPWVTGNYYALQSILFRHQVINERNKWIFGDGHLVIIENCREAAPDMAECFWLIYGLEERAFKKGGYIHFLPRPDELSRTNSGWRRDTPNYAMKKRAGGKSYTAIYDGNNELSRWLQTKNMVEKIGQTVFAYGEEALKTFKAGRSIADINKAIKTGTSAGGGREEVSQAFEASRIEAVVTGELLTGGVTMFTGEHGFKTCPVTSEGNTEALLILNGAFFWLCGTGEKIPVT